MRTTPPRAIHEFTKGADPRLCRHCDLPRSNQIHEVPASQRKPQVDESLNDMKKELYGKLAGGKRRKG